MSYLCNLDLQLNVLIKKKIYSQIVCWWVTLSYCGLRESSFTELELKEQGKIMASKQGKEEGERC